MNTLKQRIAEWLSRWEDTPEHDGVFNILAKDEAYELLKEVQALIPPAKCFGECGEDDTTLSIPHYHN